MRLLLDTHLLIWAADETHKLTREARALIADEDNTLIFSAASIWELAIKRSTRRWDLPGDPSILRRGLLENGYGELPVTSAHAVEVGLLPPIHRDPFDRMLVAQAAVEGVTLITNDAVVARYPGPVQLV